MFWTPARSKKYPESGSQTQVVGLTSGPESQGKRGHRPESQTRATDQSLKLRPN